MQGKSGSLGRSERRREKAFGVALQAIRREHGLSQEQLGFDAGFHRTYVSFLERGLKSPSLSTIMDLAETLGIQASELVRRTECILAQEQT
jgi:transcriptional regulator with XRE-family HTH domain